ncbi:DUF533 domain-containing protein [Microbulbifer agarilyticus]|uniref:DUF533 domain-containing protein n=1 Tax=Microbulbifer agarilyticus TaxID=260552 RepID=UPI001C98DEB1|nr:DUF533 domain-containing protein [Microbulbifer agarilyticus]MBY6188998.1 DUF533 domain-containing protein [Microbulbifer agarilyticus]
MNKKLLLGALIGAGMSMLNKKIRQQSAPAPGTPPPDFSKVPPPKQPGATDGSPSLDDILARASQPGGLKPGNTGSTGAPGGDIFGGAIPAGAGAGGAAVLMEMARRIFAQMQQSGGAVPGGMPGGAPGGGAQGGSPGMGGLGEILGQIFGGASGKFGQQGPQGPQNNPGGWNKVAPQGKGGLFGFVNTEAADSAAGAEQAEVMLKAMVAAAQADGRIDEAEQRNVMQALEGQLDSSEMEGLRKFLTTPISMDEVVEAVDDPATAFNLYLVSAMTINPDNPQEKAYMAALAGKLGISEQAAQVVEAQLPR